MYRGVGVLLIVLVVLEIPGFLFIKLLGGKRSSGSFAVNPERTRVRIHGFWSKAVEVVIPERAVLVIDELILISPGRSAADTGAQHRPRSLFKDRYEISIRTIHQNDQERNRLLHFVGNWVYTNVTL